MRRCELEMQLFIDKGRGKPAARPAQDVVEVVRNGKRSQEVALFFGWELLDSIDAVKKAFNL